MRTFTYFLTLEMSLWWDASCHLPFANLHAVKLKTEFSWSSPFKHFWLLNGIEFERPALMSAYQANIYHYPPPPHPPPHTFRARNNFYAEIVKRMQRGSQKVWRTYSKSSNERVLWGYQLLSLREWATKQNSINLTKIDCPWSKLP
jgi:hypothetical protein